MPISFVCPHCGTSTEVDDQYAGSSGPCATCGRTIDIPPLETATAPGAGRASETARRAVGRMSVGTICLIALGVVAAGGCVILLLAALLFPAFQAAGDARRKATCQANLRQIGAALLSYEADHGSFPPAYVTDANGTPMHSWRVLILPYLGEDLLYEQYDFDEPWDGPSNITLTNRMPACFGCPSDPQTASQETSYMVIVGPRTVFPGAEAAGRGQCRDGPGVTLCVVEVANSSVVWTEPVDLNAEKMLFEITAGGMQEMGSKHPGGANSLFCDGSVLFLPDTTSAEELEALSTRDGRENVYPPF